MPERGQSPPPERSSGKQLHDVPASGKGTDDASHKEDINKAALEVRLQCRLESHEHGSNS